ncbi:MAG: hypothetical protein ACRDUT_16170 [Mycobacterium sp.]
MTPTRYEQTSGGLLLCVPADTDARQMTDRLRVADHLAAAIGRVVAGRPAGHLRVRAG